MPTTPPPPILVSRHSQTHPMTTGSSPRLPRHTGAQWPPPPATTAHPSCSSRYCTLPQLARLYLLLPRPKPSPPAPISSIRCTLLSPSPMCPPPGFEPGCLSKNAVELMKRSTGKAVFLGLPLALVEGVDPSTHPYSTPLYSWAPLPLGVT